MTQLFAGQHKNWVCPILAFFASVGRDAACNAGFSQQKRFGR